MSAAEGVRAAIDERNREITVEAGTEIALGVGYSIVTFAVIYWLTYIFGWMTGAGCGLPLSVLAGIVTVVFIVVSMISAWRRVDPLEVMEPMSDMEEFVTVLSLATPGVFVVNPRRAVAGFASLILGGPVGIFSGIEDLRHRIPTNERMVEAAAGVLMDAERGLEVEKVREPRAAVVLRRLVLIRHEVGPGLGRIALTEKGRAIVNAAA